MNRNQFEKKKGGYLLLALIFFLFYKEMPRIPDRYYSLPAGIYTDEPSSYKIGPEEKRYLKIMRSAKNLQSRPNWNRIQIELKSRSMGANMVTNLLNCGQTLVARQILKFLNWFEVAAILIFCGTSESLSLILRGLVETIFVENTCGGPPGIKLLIFMYYLTYIFLINN